MKFTSKMKAGAAVAVLCMAATPALAQSAPTSEQEAATAIEEIVVTGSRIRRSGTQTPTPTTIIDAETITKSGVTELADLVNEIPSLFVSQSNQTSNLQGNAGLNALDLRGLGTHRTLVLVNGRRRVPAMPGTSAVDISAIPSALVQRMEIITGGASALYGADAVAGVANFILKQDYEGLEGGVSYSGSTRGDMPGYNADFLWGKNFQDGRGNLTLFGSYNNYTDTIMGQDRPWTARGTPAYRSNDDGTYRLTDGNVQVYDSYVAMVELGGRGNIWSFNPDGSLRRPVYGPGGLQGVSSNSDFYSYRSDGGEFGGRYDDYALVVPSERYNLSASSTYQLTDSIKVFGDVTYNNTVSSQLQRGYSSYGTDIVPWDSPFITAEMRAANNGVYDNVAFARRFGELGLNESQYDRTMYQATVGIEGRFNFLNQSDWEWTAAVSKGQTEQEVRYLNGTASNRYRLALDTTTGANGQAVCRSTLTDPTNGCVPLNPFKPLTQDVIDYLQYDTSPAVHSLDQTVFTAHVTGTLFNLPAGPVQTALGVEYRKEENDIGLTPEFDPTSPLFDSSIGITSNQPLQGEYDVKEAFAELRIPLLSNLPLVEDLSLETAARFSEYSTAGKTESYKLALNWTPVHDLRIRATYGQAVRAPSVSELYTAAVRQNSWIADPCNYWDPLNRTSRTENTLSNCNSLFPRGDLSLGFNDPAVTDEQRRNRTYWNNYWQWLPVYHSGNENLKVETSTTYTVGAVLQPRFIPGFSLTVDYWDIQLDDAVGSFGAQQILEKCVDLASMDNMFCGLVDRDPVTNQLQAVNVQSLNMSEFATRGIDFEARYSFRLEDIGMGPEAGTLSINAIYTKLLERSFILDATDATTHSDTVGTFGSPEWKGAIRTTWNSGPWTVNWNLRHFSPMRPGSYVTPEAYDISDTDDVFYNDFYASYQATDKVSVYGGLRNAFDREPPRLPGAEAGGANFEYGYQAGNYDVVGRTFYVGLRMKR